MRKNLKEKTWMEDYSDEEYWDDPQYTIDHSMASDDFKEVLGWYLADAAYCLNKGARERALNNAEFVAVMTNWFATELPSYNESEGADYIKMHLVEKIESCENENDKETVLLAYDDLIKLDYDDEMEQFYLGITRAKLDELLATLPIDTYEEEDWD